MTEVEWLKHNRPGKLVRFLQKKRWQRKLSLLLGESLREVVSIPALRYLKPCVDDKVRLADIPSKSEPASFPLPTAEIIASRSVDSDRQIYLGFDTVRRFHYNPSHQVAASILSDARDVLMYVGSDSDEEANQVILLRDIFGNPFRPIAIDPRWRTSDVVDLARGIYEAKAFDKMPMLADALMDAGCEEELIIAHCKGDGPHVRGCWVVDLILGKV